MQGIEEIKEQFKRVIEYSQGIPDPKVDHLFSQWEVSKKKFIERFGGLIYEHPVPVEFSLDDKEKHNRLMEFIDEVYYTYNNEELADFLSWNENSFFENKVSTVKNEKIPKGMKLIKAFKYFEKNPKRLRDIQDAASQIIQEDKVKGTLCFSVHPLDYLSSSENTYNWRSCHALNGEYRAGNLSYMADNSTFMVYIKGADNVVLPSFPEDVKWNSKKWRMLIHASEKDEIMFAGRQYPFSSKPGIDTVLNIYNVLYCSSGVFDYRGKSSYTGWSDRYIDAYKSEDPDLCVELDEKYVIYKRQLIALTDLVHQEIKATNYCDILNSTVYRYPYYAVLNHLYYYGVNRFRDNPLKIGKEVNCLHCGNEIILNPETMRCNCCELEYGYEQNDNYGTCECCGARISYDDCYCVEEQHICASCFDDHCFSCEECGEVYFKEKRRCIGNDEDDLSYVCVYCAEDKKENNYYG